MSITNFDAIISLRPKAQFALNDDVLDWHDKTQTKPTDSEIAAEKTKLETEYADKKYQRDRAAEYPRLVEQLDDIYHNGIDAWKATIKKTKDKYPKS
jgi:hypothetical protein|tara:strand:- start:50 stop:340 length:291 start_codon:yes stop_codon:yes gene_type:complete